MESHGAVRLAGLVIGLWLQGRSEPEAARPCSCHCAAQSRIRLEGIFPHITVWFFFVFVVALQLIPSLTHSLTRCLPHSLCLPPSIC